MNSQIIIEDQKVTAIPEDIFLQLTTKMIGFQNNKCNIQNMHNGAIKKLRLKFSEETCKSRAYE